MIDQVIQFSFFFVVGGSQFGKGGGRSGSETIALTCTPRKMLPPPLLKRGGTYPIKLCSPQNEVNFPAYGNPAR